MSARFGISTPGTAPLAIPIRGMTCASCVARVERAIRRVDGVAEASVNLAAEEASVALTESGKVSAVVTAIRDVGYDPIEERVELVLSGMSCASCVGRVERALGAVPGVIEANVNLATGRAMVRFVGGAQVISALLDAAKIAGYPAQVLRPDSSPTDPAQDERERELASLTRAFIVAAAASLPLLVLEMGGHVFPGLHHVLATTFGDDTIRLVSFALASMVQFWPGLRFYIKGGPALLRGAPDMNSLVMLGTSTAYAYSVLSTFAPTLLPTGMDYTYFEAGAVIIALVLLGRLLETRAKGRASEAIGRLLKLREKTARVLRDGQERDIAIDEVIPGDIVVMRPGERLPVDGRVVAGSSYVDEAMITGEPIPAFKGAGAEVIGGTINKTGTFQFEAARVGADTLLEQIVRTVAAAQSAKLPIQALVDRVTLWFVPAILACAALTFLLWIAFGPAPSLSLALVNAVAVLIIACPCAMGLATPTSIIVATGKAAEMGVLFRRGSAMQALRRVRTVALDKTGTLTEGRPELTDLVVAPGSDETEVLRLVASVESRSEHPIAEAIVTAARRRDLTLVEPEHFEAEPGLGVSATLDRRQIVVGTERLVRREGADPSAFADEARLLSEHGKTPLFAAIDGRIAAVMAVSDPVKVTSRGAIDGLRDLGLRVVLVTGDTVKTAEAVARLVGGVDEVVAEVLPTEKAAVVQRLRQSGPVAFVGDGINDAPALAEADVGIAIGTGTDIAMETADVVLMSGNLRNVPNAITLSKVAMRNIAQNLFWAFGYNVLLVPVAAGALFPVFGVLMSPMIAGLAMAFSSVSVMCNALRLRDFRPPVPLEGPLRAMGGAAKPWRGSVRESST